jgi:hypothetical protein
MVDRMMWDSEYWNMHYTVFLGTEGRRPKSTREIHNIAIERYCVLFIPESHFLLLRLATPLLGSKSVAAKTVDGRIPINFWKNRC